MVSSPNERCEKWCSLKVASGGGEASSGVPVDLTQDFGLGRYMPLNPAIGGERHVLPHSVAKSLFDRASQALNVHDHDSLIGYWKAREDANGAVTDEQLNPEQLEAVKAWHAANPAPPPVEMLSDGLPEAGAATPGPDDNVAKWKAASDGGAAAPDGRVAKWKAVKSAAPAPVPPA